MLVTRGQHDAALTLAAKAKDFLSRLLEHIESFADVCHDSAMTLMKNGNKFAEVLDLIALCLESLYLFVGEAVAHACN